MSLAPKEGPGGQGINAESGLEVDSFSGLEVNWAAQRDGSLPQTVEKSNEIEAVQQTKRVCGLSRKVFWIVLVVAVLVIVGAAVGGGVGASVKSDHSSNDITNDVANSTAAMNAVLPNTKLATFNFTENQADQSCVFFQSSEASLYQSLWNSSTKLWMTAPTVLNGSEVQIKQNTPLAASVRSESSGFSFFLFFLDTANRLRAYTTSDLSGTWIADTDNGIDKRINVPSNSPLLTYSDRATGYVDSQFVVWQDETSGKLQIICMSSTCGQRQTDLDSAFPAMSLNSSLALAPLYSRVGSSDPQLAMYGHYGGLWEAHYTHVSDSEWNWTSFRTTQDLGVSDLSKMTATASLTALSMGWYLAADNRTAPEHVQVLWTQPDGRGVSIKANVNESWQDLNSSVPIFGDVAPYSSIAANQAGKVYAVEETEGGTGPQLVEWQFFGENASYERVGVLDTKIQR